MMFLASAFWGVMIIYIPMADIDLLIHVLSINF